MIRFATILCVCLGLAQAGVAQTYDTLRIATYNLLNYSDNSTVRNPEFRKVLQAIDPDLIVVQEMVNSAGLSSFLSDVLNYGQPGTYTAAPFSNGPDTDNGMCYKTAKLQFIGPQTVLPTALRDINGYRLRPVGVSADSLDIQIYSAHLKASQGYETDRAAEAETLRTHLNSLPDGGFFIAAGDFNLYTSTEPAYQNFIGSQADNSGRLYDPINTPGSWHGDPSFSGIHTQSSRVRAFDGGATGGMDDRFDFVLLSYNFPYPNGWDYVSGSYTEFGNDGNHFNDSINAPPNLAVPDSIANALHAASDHLPVYLDVRRATGETPSITVVSPNGSESWSVGSPRDITWTSQYLTGTVSIRLNRSYPSGAWETVIGGTANDGIHSWTVTGPATTAARIRILSDSDTSVADVSDANFSITQTATLTVLLTNGGEQWNIGQTGTIQWNGSGFTGNVRIELDRAYPSGSWTVLYGSAINDGNEQWPVSGPPTTHARLRIYSLSVPTVGDTSDADFVIRYSAPPSISHDPHGDCEPGTVVFTAQITDDFAGVTGKLFYRLADTASFDSIAMSTTGYPNEFAASVELDAGRWMYFIRALDSHSQATFTDTFGFIVGPSCGQSLAYDDGSAELFHWSIPDSFLWAVRFTPPEVPFALCGAEFAVAAFHPDSSHSQVRIQVLAVDGPLGMPGTVLREVVRGSIGNVIGGFPAPGAYWAGVVLFDDITEPLEFVDDFYVAVGNLDGKAEAFALDTSSANAGRSVVFDPCEESWIPEDGIHENSRNGNRMIRIHGWSGSPEDVVIWRSGDDLRLTWSPNGAPFYKVYKSLTAEFGSPEPVGTTSDTSLVVGSVTGNDRAFYRVVSASAP